MRGSWGQFDQSISVHHHREEGTLPAPPRASAAVAHSSAACGRGGAPPLTAALSMTVLDAGRE